MIDIKQKLTGIELFLNMIISSIKSRNVSLQTEFSLRQILIEIQLLFYLFIIFNSDVQIDLKFGYS